MSERWGECSTVCGFSRSHNAAVTIELTSVNDSLRSPDMLLESRQIVIRYEAQGLRGEGTKHLRACEDIFTEQAKWDPPSLLDITLISWISHWSLVHISWVMHRVLSGSISGMCIRWVVVLLTEHVGDWGVSCDQLVCLMVGFPRLYWQCISTYKYSPYPCSNFSVLL